MIDWTKPVRTKLDKVPVTVLTTKGRGVRPVIGYLDRQPVGITPENDIPRTWGADGSHYLPWMELENVPPPPPPPVVARRVIIWRYYPAQGNRVSCSVVDPTKRPQDLLPSGWHGDGSFVEIQEVMFKKGQEDASSSK